MMRQENLFEEVIDLNASESKGFSDTSFRTLHYLGSKLRILRFIKEVADELDPDKGGVCDLFSGSGAVSQYFAKERRVMSVDIQQYSNVICSALLNPCRDPWLRNFSANARRSERLGSYKELFQPLISYEEALINKEGAVDLEVVCNFLENASLYGAIESIPALCTDSLAGAFNQVIREIKRTGSQSFLATKYFGGIYFSYSQAVELDVILELIELEKPEYRNTLLAALLSTASDIVNTVGKQFAQPIRPRDKNGKPKKGILNQLKKDRTLNVFDIFDFWLERYMGVNSCSKKHVSLCIDYYDALNFVDQDISIIYADPPYTRDHYSRFYHCLETLCRKDFPIISTTNIGGTTRLSRGLYRSDRHQSPFCIKSTAPMAFENLFKKVAQLDKILMLSYSPYDKSKSAHPRVVDVEDLIKIANKYFKSVTVRSPGRFTHSKLNHSRLHLKAEDSAEILLVCSNSK
jgi:adenine-specific DNA methylase